MGYKKLLLFSFFLIGSYVFCSAQTANTQENKNNTQVPALFSKPDSSQSKKQGVKDSPQLSPTGKGSFQPEGKKASSINSSQPIPALYEGKPK